jgi:hypothetical protein
MYHGPCEHMVEWFMSLGYPYDAALHGVPSDWVLDLVAIGFAKPKRFYGHTIRSAEELQDASQQFLACYQVRRGAGGEGGSEAAVPGLLPGAGGVCMCVCWGGGGIDIAGAEGEGINIVAVHGGGY